MTAPPKPGPGWLRTVLAVVLLVLPVTLGVGLWVWQDHERDVAKTASEEDAAAVRAATLLVTTWGTVDYRKLDDYFADVKAGSTGKFLEEFSQTEDFLREGLVENESVQVPTIPRDGAGLLERDGATARVIVTMDATVTNKSSQGPQARQYRMQLTLEKVQGEWLTSNLEIVS